MDRPDRSSVHARVRLAKAGARRLAQATGDERSRLLTAMADALAQPSQRQTLLHANDQDVAEAEVALAKGQLSRALVDRLRLSVGKLDGLVDGLRQLASQADRVGETLCARELDEGLVLRQVSCPLGVLAVVFEARPDAVPQITGLAVRTGNAVVLKGGHEARRSNRALVDALREVLHLEGFDPNAIELLEDRGEVAHLLELDRDVDLVIARGSAQFVRHVQSSTKIPVLGHAEGLCHVYLHASADPAMAAAVVVDAKCSYPAACNAVETLLWDAAAGAALDRCVLALQEQGVELRGCERSRARHPELRPATEADWSTEYGDKILALRCVDDLEDALEHIDRYGSRHTEAIVAEDTVTASVFLAAVDAGNVFHNASTRFADGYRYGLGAEVGVSTSKLHARGPVGTDGLLTYRWLLIGTGHVTSDYGSGKKSFRHRDL